MEEIESAVKLLFHCVLWLLLASPILIAFFFIRKAMLRRNLHSNLAIFCFSFVLALLIAPMPTPIITVFFPHGYAAIDWSYYAQINKGFFRDLWPFIAISLLLTFVLTLSVSIYYFHPSRSLHNSSLLFLKTKNKIAKHLLKIGVHILVGMALIWSISFLSSFVR